MSMEQAFSFISAHYAQIYLPEITQVIRKSQLSHFCRLQWYLLFIIYANLYKQLSLVC